MAETTKLPERTVKAREAELFTPGYDSRIWTHVMREGVAFDDILKPIYWTSLAARLGVNTRFHHHIACVNEEHTFYALLYVRSVQENQMIVAPLVGPLYFGEIETDKDATLFTKWNVGAKSYDVARRADNKVVKPGFPTKEQAQAWIVDHLSKVAA